MKKLILFIALTALAFPIGAQTAKKGSVNRTAKQTTQINAKATTSTNNTQVAKPAKKAPTLTVVTPPTPEHKVYTGKFSLPECTDGEASYSYLPSPTGERVFDGPFQFIGYSNEIVYKSAFQCKVGYTYNGIFKNNHQVGTWIATTIENGDTLYFCSYQFNNLGLLDGTVHFRNLKRSRKNLYDSSYLYYVDKITFQYSMGKIEGPVHFEYIDYSNPQNNITARGNYQNDKPIGSWEFSNYPYPIVPKKDNYHKSYWETTTIDESTGDKTIQREDDLNSFYDIDSKIEDAVEEILQFRDSKIDVFKSNCIYLNSEYDKRDGYSYIFYDSYGKTSIWLDGLKLKNENSTELNNKKYLAKYILDNISLPTDVPDTVVNVFIDIFTDNEDKVHILESAQDTKTSPAVAKSIADVLKSIDWKPYPRDENGKYEGMIFNLNFLVDTKYVKQTIFKRRQAAKEEEQRRLFPVQEPQEAQQSQQKSDGEIYSTVEQQAEFPGGVEALFKWLSTNIKYPEDAQKDGIQGKVWVKFVVNTDGSISDIQIYRGVHPSLDAEAIRLVKRMPKWQPGKHNGVPVRSTFTFPIAFHLNN